MAPTPPDARRARGGPGPVSTSRTIVVAGGGIAGLTAAVEAAESGYEVVLVEKSARLGGRVAQLHRYFPKLCPPLCGLEIQFQRIRKEPRIRVLTLAEVERIEGEAGDFRVTVSQAPRYVTERCTACGACVTVCPRERPDRLNLGIGRTKAIHLAHPMAFPMRYVIDDAHCALAECGACVSACAYGAIDLAAAPATIVLHAGAVVVATGWAPYDAALIDNLGFGRYPNVITNLMMERLASPTGPTRGRILRPSDGKPVTRAAFVQCAGSRDVNHLGYCSGVCCLASLKQATYLREQNREATAHIFAIDLRTPGSWELFARQVLADPAITATRGKVARIVEDEATGDLTVEAEDILAGGRLSVTVELVVLAAGMASSQRARPIQGLALDDDAFVVPNGDGVVAAGCARGPADVATAAQEATAAALAAIQAIRAVARRVRAPIDRHDGRLGAN